MGESYLSSKRRRLRYIEAQRQGIPTSLVPAGPVVDRIETLTGLGWSLEALAAWHGQGSASALARIHRGRSERVERKLAGVAELPVTVAVPDHVPDLLMVPSLGARRRVQALLRLGWRHEDITLTAGVSSWSFSRSRGYIQTPAASWRAIAAAYEQMSAHPGPSTKARKRAERSGYLAPLAWDDIDDPAENPHQAAEMVDPEHVDPAVVLRILAGEWRLPSTNAERRAVVAAWSGNLNDLARLTGWRVARYTQQRQETAA